MTPVFLEGKDIFLGPLTGEAKMEGYVSWLNNQETTLFMGSGRFPMDDEDIKKYIAAFSKSKDGMILGIFLKKPARHIGNITLHMIDWRNSNAEIGVMIGDKKARGKGYATEAIHLVADHAFNKLNLHKLYTGMIKGNEASRRAFEKADFKIEGILKEHFYLNGEYLDCYRLGILRKENIKK
ncbi:MAG: N-acetyltransferase [Nitrospiraceae bacterium]|nr:MAG: N-acetyltransferase [Nitrospiraceae bacterium]